jgi:Rrf2 family protein
MISRTAEHALRALIVLARRFPDGLVRAEEIATILGAPRNYMSKTLHVLAQRGILTSVRGPHGGFALAIPPDRLCVAEVVEVFAEPNDVRSTCLLGSGPCDPRHPCAAHQRWTELTSAAREPLLRTTIAELSAEPRRGRPTMASDSTQHDGRTLPYQERIS